MSCSGKRHFQSNSNDEGIAGPERATALRDVRNVCRWGRIGLRVASTRNTQRNAVVTGRRERQRKQ